MEIFVSEKGFGWRSADGRVHTTKELRGPPCCFYEHLEVIRDGSVIDEASIHVIGTHANYEGFSGLTEIIPGRYHMSLKYEMFKVGDILRIKKLPRGVSENEYWEGLSRS